MPCPGPCPKCSPWPAASIISRATASIARPRRRSPIGDGRLERRRSLPPGRGPRARTPRRRGRRARRRTASGSCRCGSRRPAPRSRTAGPHRPGRAGHPGSRAAGPPRVPTGRSTSKASASAPPVRISHSSRQRQVGFRHAGLDLGQQRGQRPVRHRTGRGDPLQLGRLLVARSASTQPSIGHELDVGCRGRQPLPDRMRHEPGLHADPPRPDPTRRAPASAPGRSW